MSDDRREQVTAALRALEERGRLSAERVVESARDDDSPLHDCFEWDDSTAAERYRIEQARVLIRSVKVTLQMEERTLQVVRYVRDPNAKPEDQGYITVDALRDNHADAVALLCYEVARAEAIFERVRSLLDALESKEAQEIASQFERADRSVKKLAKRVRMMQPGA